jgi:hypothetical protein
MEQLDKVVKSIQSKALIAVYMDMRTGVNSSATRVHTYMETIDVINKEFQTHYESSNLESMARKFTNVREGVLKSPLLTE